jgi:hypothetical protein
MTLRRVVPNSREDDKKQHGHMLQEKDRGSRCACASSPTVLYIFFRYFYYYYNYTNSHFLVYATVLYPMAATTRRSSRLSLSAACRTLQEKGSGSRRRRVSSHRCVSFLTFSLNTNDHLLLVYYTAIVVPNNREDNKSNVLLRYVHDPNRLSTSFGPSM